MSKRDAALARREKLKALIADLQKELSIVEREIRLYHHSPGIALTHDFFWTYVVPILRNAGENGLTSAGIRAALDKYGMPIEPGKFRVFLSRARKRGWLEFVPQTSGHQRWRLAANIDEI